MVTEPRRKTAAPEPLDDETFARRCVAICEDRKAVDVRLYDVRGSSILTDFYIICSGNSEPHLKAIAAHLDEDMRSAGFAPRHVDGTPASRWIVIDFGVVIIHLFHPKVREYYDIERLLGADKMISQSNQDETVL